MRALKAIAQCIRECGGTQSLYLLLELVFFSRRMQWNSLTIPNVHGINAIKIDIEIQSF